MANNVLITGATGYIGSLLVKKILAKNKESDNVLKVFSFGRREIPQDQRDPQVTYISLDIRSKEIFGVIKEHKINTVVHTAAVVNPDKGVEREMIFAVDVTATKQLLEACIKNNVEQFIYLSSGAVYGYYPDHPEWLTEEDPIRGNVEYPYAYHKTCVEEIMQSFAKSHPKLKQLILRAPAVLGETTDSQITNLLNKNPMVTVGGSDCPFVFIWDQDLVRCIYEGIVQQKEGVFNVAGDGKLSVFELAKLQGRKVTNYPIWLMKMIMGTAKTLRLTKNGAEVVVFVLYRPVLSNEKLKREFGFIPEKTTKEVFELYINARDKK